MKIMSKVAAHGPLMPHEKNPLHKLCRLTLINITKQKGASYLLSNKQPVYL